MRFAEFGVGVRTWVGITDFSMIIKDSTPYGVADH